MTRKIFISLMVLLAAAFIVLPACDSGGGGGGGTQGTGFLTGTWAGTLKDGGTTWAMVMNVGHTGGNISGNLTLTLGTSILSGDITGTVSNAHGNGVTQFAWVISSSGTTYQFVGTYTAVKMEGTWTNLLTNVTGTFRVYYQ